MAELALVAAVASTALTAVGTIAAGNAYAAKGQAEQQVAQWEAKQYDIRALEEKAHGQREMFQLRRQKELALSTLQARAAASGFSATDPTALGLADEISKYGTLQEQSALAGGMAREQEMHLAGAGRRYSGAVANALGQGYQTASYLSAGGTILGGLSGLASKYGGSSGGFTPTAPLPGSPLVINRYGLRYG